MMNFNKDGLYFYDDFFRAIKKWWFLLIIGLVIGAAIPFFVNFNKEVAVATVHLQSKEYNNTLKGQERYREYVIRLNTMATNINSLILNPNSMQALGSEQERDNINKNLRVIENAYTGDIILEYNLKGGDKLGKVEQLKYISNQIVNIYSYTKTHRLLSAQFNGVEAITKSLNQKIGYSVFGAFTGIFLMIGFIMFLDAIFKNRRGKH